MNTLRYAAALTILAIAIVLFYAGRAVLALVVLIALYLIAFVGRCIQMCQGSAK